MKDQNICLADRCHLFFLTFFYSGKIPKAPGTFGSLASIPLILLLSYMKLSLTGLVLTIFVLLILSSLSADYIQKKYNISDPGWIVIDEVLGMLVTWLFVFPSINWLQLLLTFILFRFFDITKIFPISWFDKNIKNGFGTMIDDIIAGLLAGMTLLLINFFTGLN